MRCMMRKYRTWIIVVAAGKGKRFGGSTPKQFIQINGKPLFLHTLEALWNAFPFDGMIIALPPGKENNRYILGEFSDNDKIILTAGGRTRTASVKSSLKKLPAQVDIVLVHDAARPKISGRLVSSIVDGAVRFGACVPLLTPCDTVKELSAQGVVLRTLDRDRLGLVQTPQGFRKELLLEAYRKCRAKSFPDDAALLEKLGYDVHYVEGSYQNIKVTTPLDLERIFPQLALRIGHGYDVHRLRNGRKLVLAGVPIASPKGEMAHSDGDVALHALMDAMLGAAALGDIGKYFPPSDPKLKGISSLVLLEKTSSLLRGSGWKVEQIDITILLQFPKISPYLGCMRRTVAGVLDIPPDRVSIKATTEEGLGLTGKGQAVAAHAVVLVRKI
jgi:2-C-methyl-D-erythritol 4-phosphate cytidylyltransferase/2-C-methyl-D-erythritol 2,4-cyclodiphosphate synthase